MRLAKHLPPLTDAEKARLEKLASLPLHKHGEADVREAYLAPIVELLGYERGGDKDVVREDMRALSPSFVMLGSHKYKLDYNFIVWKQGFWLLEAKSALCEDPKTPPAIAVEDVNQAFAYALHHQVDAPYYAVSNGWWFCLYDRDSGTQDPILKISQAELPKRFDELRQVIGAEQITFHLKRRLISRIEQVLSADVTLERSEEFLREVERVVSKVRPKVLDNFRAARKKAAPEKAFWARLLDTERPYHLVETALASAVSIKDMADVSETLADRLLAVPNSGDMYVTLSKLLIETPRAMLLHEHFNTLYALAVLAQRQGDTAASFPDSTLPGSKSPLPLKEIFAKWAHVLLTHFHPRPPLRFLWATEAILGRIAKRAAVYNAGMRRGIMQAVDFKKFQLPEEMVAAITLCPAGDLITAVTVAQMGGLDAVIGETFDNKRREFLPAKARQEYERLRQAEQRLIAASLEYPQLLHELGSGWSELLMIDSVNVSYDKLGAGVCDVLKMFPTLTANLPVECHDPIRALAGLSVPYAVECCRLIGKEPSVFESAEAEAQRKRIFDPFS